MERGGGMESSRVDAERRQGLGWSLEGGYAMEGYPREREDCVGNDDEGGKQRALGRGQLRGCWTSRVREVPW